MKTQISAAVIVALLLGIMSAAFAVAPKAKVPAKPAGARVVKAKPATPSPEAAPKTALAPSRTKAAPVKSKGHLKRSTKGYHAVRIEKHAVKKPVVKKHVPKTEEQKEMEGK